MNSSAPSATSAALGAGAVRRPIGCDDARAGSACIGHEPTLSCPHCGTKLKQACRRCKAPLEPSWRLCPYCETATTAQAQPVAEQRTRREPTTERPVR